MWWHLDKALLSVWKINLFFWHFSQHLLARENKRFSFSPSILLETGNYVLKSFYRALFVFRLTGRSQTTLTRFWLFWPPTPLCWPIFSLWTLTKSQHFKTTYPPPLVNVVCERTLIDHSSTYYVSTGLGTG